MVKIDWDSEPTYEYGIKLEKPEYVPPWARKKITSYNLLDQNKKKQISLWEVFLECGHCVRVTLPYDESPKGWYRDCVEEMHPIKE